MKPRVIIADKDISYIIPLQSKIIEELRDSIILEIYTDELLFAKLFEKPQKIELLIISDDLYTSEIMKHNIDHLFLMTEDASLKSSLSNATAVFKYSNIKSVYSQIIGKVSTLRPSEHLSKNNQLVCVTSASGGVGKTTVALGICEYLSTRVNKRVLYINANSIQYMHHCMIDQNIINDTQIYKKITSAKTISYSDIRHVIRHLGFDYLPPLKASLIMLGCDKNVFLNIAKTSKESGEYDYVIVDTDHELDDFKVSLLNESDKVLIVTDQTRNAELAADKLVSDINGISADKYIFVCNKCRSNQFDAIKASDYTLRYSIDENVESIDNYDICSAADFASIAGIQRISYLLM